MNPEQVRKMLEQTLDDRRLTRSEPAADRDDLARCQQLVITMETALVGDTAATQPGDLQGDRQQVLEASRLAGVTAG